MTKWTMRLPGIGRYTLEQIDDVYIARGIDRKFQFETRDTWAALMSIKIYCKLNMFYKKETL
jgi:hypothetical protein